MTFKFLGTLMNLIVLVCKVNRNTVKIECVTSLCVPSFELFSVAFNERGQMFTSNEIN